MLDSLKQPLKLAAFAIVFMLVGALAYKWWAPTKVVITDKTTVNESKRKEVDRDKREVKERIVEVDGSVTDRTIIEERERVRDERANVSETIHTKYVERDDANWMLGGGIGLNGREGLDYGRWIARIDRRILGQIYVGTWYGPAAGLGIGASIRF